MAAEDERSTTAATLLPPPPPLPTTPPLPPLRREDCRYTSHFCEENVYWLAHEFALAELIEQHCYVVFISNATATVPLWHQRAASSPGTPVVWVRTSACRRAAPCIPYTPPPHTYYTPSHTALSTPLPPPRPCPTTTPAAAGLPCDPPCAAAAAAAAWPPCALLLLALRSTSTSSGRPPAGLRL